MADYIKREDAMSHPFANGHFDKEHAIKDFIFGHECYKAWINTLPAADVVEVVRCRDCRFYDTDVLPDGSYYDGLCRNYDKGIKGWFPKKDDFCSGGERRKDNMTDWVEVEKLTRNAYERFFTEYREFPSTVIVPPGIISLLKKECPQFMTKPESEPVRFWGMIYRESPRIKSIESLEVY